MVTKETKDYININNIEYVHVDNILSKALVYSKGVRTGKELIKKHKIDKNNYIFGRLNKDNQWIQTEGKSLKYDKVLFTLSFVNTINEMKEEDISIAPPIIKLKDDEKFFDDEGNILEIEVRGSKEVNDIYFKVKDVAYGFEIFNLSETLLDKRNEYNNKHYKYFNCKKPVNNRNKTNKDIIKKTLFLTYEGILRVLFVSRNKKTSNFISWATNTLFTIQMGSKEDKQKLFDKVLGNNIESSRNAIKCNTNKLSCIYLLTLGYVKDIKQNMNISDKYSDTDIVCKYGFTDDLERRLKEHQINFNKIKNIDIKLKYYTYIDHNELSKAENRLKNMFKLMDNFIEYQDYKEIVVISQDNFNIVKDKFDDCKYLFIGDKYEILKVIDNLKHQLDIKDRDVKMEVMQYKHQIELLQKDIEIISNKVKNKLK